MTIKQIAKEVISDFNLQYPLNIYKFCKILNIKIYREDIDMDVYYVTMEKLQLL